MQTQRQISEVTLRRAVRSFTENPNAANCRDLVTLAQSLPRTQADTVLSSLADALGEARAVADALREPPHQAGVFWEKLQDDGIAEVKGTASGQILLLKLPSELGPLSVGQRVWFNAAGAVVAVGQAHVGDHLTVVSELLGDDEVIIEDTGGSTRTILRLAQALQGGVRKGDQLRYDPELALATGLVKSDQHDEMATINEFGDLSLSDVIVAPMVMDELMAIRDEIVEAVNACAMPRILSLFTGPPGVGKTLACKGLVSELARILPEDRLAYEFVAGSELVSSLLGQSSANIRALFERVRRNAARGSITLVAWDELGATFPMRDVRSLLWPSTIVETFLTCLDGIKSAGGLVMLGTCNRPDLVDPALLRPGRLGQRVIRFTRPSLDLAKDLFELYLEEHELSEPRDRMAELISESIYAQDAARISFREGDDEMLPRSALMSGDAVRSIVEHAARLQRLRRRQKIDAPISMTDLEACSDAYFNALPITPANIASFVDDWALSKIRGIDSVVKMVRHEP